MDTTIIILGIEKDACERVLVIYKESLKDSLRFFVGFVSLSIMLSLIISFFPEFWEVFLATSLGSLVFLYLVTWSAKQARGASKELRRVEQDIEEWRLEHSKREEG